MSERGAVSGERRILGIDPGLAVTGFGIIDAIGTRASAAAMGTIRTRVSDGRAPRLGRIAERVGELIDEYHPDEMAVEQQYVAKNVRSAMALGEARAAAMVAAAMRGIPVFEFPPSSIKEAVTGHGAAPKEQVQQMVMVHLGLDEPPSPLDVSDALAVAIARLADLSLEMALARGA